MSSAGDVPSFRDYVDLLRRYWWLVIAGLLAGIAVGYVASSDSTGSHEARADLLVQLRAPERESLDSRDESRLVGTAAEIAQSSYVERLVAEQLGDAEVPGVNAAVTAGTSIVSISVTDPDSGAAVEAVNAYAAAMTTALPELLDVDVTTISTAERAGAAPSSTRRWVTVLGFVGALGGFVAAATIDVSRRHRRRQSGADAE